MPRSLTVSVPDELYAEIKNLSEADGLAADDIVVDWLNEALSRHQLSRYLASAGVSELTENISPPQQRELTHLLRETPESLDDAAQIRLSELLRQVRHGMVRQAQAITDWLAAETTTAYEVAVTQLATVESSMLYAVGYDADRQVLEVVFNSGGIYRYLDVPPTLYKDLLDAHSKGRFMWEHIFNLFPYERLRIRQKRTAT